MISRKFEVIGNLKMHAVSSILKQYQTMSDRSFGLMVPYPYLYQACEMFSGTQVVIGAQHVSGYASGAYTGRVSCEMLVDVGVSRVLIGHGETKSLGEVCAKQLEQAKQAGLSVVLCVGEDLMSYQQGRRFEVLRAQLSVIADLASVVIAYEPLWSIGTGVVPSVEEIESVVCWIREHLESRAGNCGKVRVLYGGSINQNNCFEIYQHTSLDGFLVGGVSLKPEVMMEVIEQCQSY